MVSITDVLRHFKQKTTVGPGFVRWPKTSMATGLTS